MIKGNKDIEGKTDLVTITIDGTELKVADKSSIIEAAESIGIHIPVLCDFKSMRPFGACKICTVEAIDAKGSKMRAACVLKASDGLIINTQHPEAIRTRHDALISIIERHPLECTICDKSGECELQDLVDQFAIMESPTDKEKLNIPPVYDNPFIAREMSKCMLASMCRRCVRICKDIQGVEALDYVREGVQYIVPKNAQVLDCEFCGQCVAACPVGCIIDATFKNKLRAWDCVKTTTVCPHCGVGCNLEINTYRNQFMRVTTEPNFGINKGWLCVRGRFGCDYVQSDKRLNTPLVKDGNSHKVASWEQAYKTAAERLSSIIEQHGADSVSAVLSARASNQSNQAMIQFMRNVIGSENIGATVSYKQPALIEAMAATRGTYHGSASLQDIADSEVVVCGGFGFVQSHPVIANMIFKAVQDNRAKVVGIGSADHKLTGIKKSIFLTPKPGCELNVYIALAKAVSELPDKETKGLEKVKRYKSFTNALGSYEYAKLLDGTGISQAEVKKAAETIGAASKVTFIISPEDEAAVHDIEAATAFCNLALISNTDDKAICRLLPTWEKVNTLGVLDMLSGLDGDIKRILGGIIEGRIKALLVMGDDLLNDFSVHDRLREKLENLELLVVIDPLQTAMTEIADIALPCTTLMECDGTVTNIEGRVQRLGRALFPAENIKPEPEILQQLAKAMGKELHLQGVTARVQEAMVVKNAGFVALKARELSEGESKIGGLRAMVGKDLFHHGKLTEASANIAKLERKGCIYLNPTDAEQVGITDGDTLSLSNHKVEIKAIARINRHLAVPKGAIHIPSSELDMANQLDLLYSLADYLEGKPPQRTYLNIKK